MFFRLFTGKITLSTRFATGLLVFIQNTLGLFFFFAGPALGQPYMSQSVTLKYNLKYSSIYFI